MNAIAPIEATPPAESALVESLPAQAEIPPILADSLLNFLARAMADPSINVDKLQVLLTMQHEIVARDARLQFNRAMSAAQGKMQPVLRDAVNDQTKSKYARLETIDAAVRPIYTRHGFCLEFNSEPTGGSYERIVCEVSHTSGHSKQFQLEAAVDTAGPQGRANKTPLHGLGSTVSYLRRYLTCMIFNIVLADDNDGNRTRGRQSDDGELGGRTQTDELYALLAECSADPAAVVANERAFLTKMGLGDLRSMADARVGDFVRLKNALLTKKSVLAQRRAQTPNTQAGAAA
jgi:hypothetical protein